MWATELLLLTVAKACWVKSHRSCVFLLRSCIEFKQEQHSCGNTLLHLWRTPREKPLSSSGATTHQCALCLSLCLRTYQSQLHLHVTNDDEMLEYLDVYSPLSLRSVLVTSGLIFCFDTALPVTQNQDGCRLEGGLQPPVKTMWGQRDLVNIFF